MARVHVRKARKDYPQNGVKKGDTYYFCQIKTGPRSSRILRSLTRFKPSQLTTSEFLSTAYELQERIEELDTENLEDSLQEIAEEIRSLGDEQYDKLSNMPEGLQQAPTGELLQQRQDMCEEWASNLEGIEIPEEVVEPAVEPEKEDFKTEEEYEAAFTLWEDATNAYEEYEQALQSALEEAHGYGYEGE